MKHLPTLLCVLAAPVFADPVFEDLSDRLPLHVYDGDWEHFVGGGVAVLDCNGDLRPDIFAAGGSNPAKLIRNDGNFAFTDLDLPEMTGVTGAYPIDIDGDGLLDLFVLRVGANKILRGQGDCKFIDATEALGLPEHDAWSTAFTAWWETGATRPTLAIGNYVDRSDPDGPFEACDDNTILRPDNRGYTRQTLSPGFCALSILAANDARGRPTLRLSNDRHYYVSGGFEQMWDIAEARFLGPEDGWNNVSLWGMGIASRDLDADGRDEVMLTSMGDQLLQLAQEDGTYQAAPFTIGTYSQRPHVGDDGRPSTGWHAEFGDIDNDGRADLFIAKGNVDQMPGMAMEDPNNLLLQNVDGTFRETAATAGVATTERSRGAALVDFDGDGRQDLIVTNRRAPLELYRNVTAATGAWINVDLRQSGPNPFGVGAVITVDTDTATQIVQRVIGGGHAGGQMVGQHFGLGDTQSAQVSVLWPDGSQSQTSVAVDQRVLIEKPKHNPAMD